MYHTDFYQPVDVCLFNVVATHFAITDYTCYNLWHETRVSLVSKESLVLKLTMSFRKSDLDPTVVPYSWFRLETFLQRLKPELRVIVATACSTTENEILPEYVSIIFLELHPSSDGSPASFELEADGWPAMKKKLGTPRELSVTILALRNNLVTAIKSQWGYGMTRNVQEGFNRLNDPLNRILKIKWLDPDGPHV